MPEGVSACRIVTVGRRFDPCGFECGRSFVVFVGGDEQNAAAMRPANPTPSKPRDETQGASLSPASSLNPSGRVFLRAAQLVALFLVAAHIGHTAFDLGGDSLKSFFDNWVYNGLIVAAALFCLARAALVVPERRAWLSLGIALAFWAAGEIYYSAVLATEMSPPYPSVADGFYLAFYPASYIGLWLLVRGRLRQAPLSLALDGLIAGLAVSAVTAAVILPPVLQSTGAAGPAAATTLAYPLADVLMLALCAGFFTLDGWRPGRAWGFIGAGLALTALADIVFLYQSSNGTYVEGTMLDSMWPAAALLLGYAAWQPFGRRSSISMGRWSLLLVPSVSALSAVALLLYDHFTAIESAAVGLAAGTLVAAVARLAMTFMENMSMLALSRHHALTDALTGLSNRRRFHVDLEEELAHAHSGSPLLLALFDLNGFKRYNDTYGHPAGDALLARLGRSLEAAVKPLGHAYRLGGDEFCILVKVEQHDVDAIVATAAAALSERGTGFTIHASHGAVVLPQETTDPEAALRLADGRLYEQKGQLQRTSFGQQMGGVLLQALAEREPGLTEHMRQVAELAGEVGRRLSLSGEELDELSRAAELHDIGKMAVPDAVLKQPGRIPEADLDLVRQHTLVGERILNSAAPMRGVAKLVRSSHERYDGGGYPDGLAGDKIPLGARIIAACDAFETITSGRHRPAVSTDGALEELRRCAGSQFDPDVVRILSEVLSSRAASHAHAAVEPD
jgi:two-component system, cell cycle response regulator